MEQFRLSGSKDRCVWCGESDKGNYKEIEFKEAKKTASTNLVLVCSDACKKELCDTEKGFEGKLPIFFINILISFVLAIAGTVLLKINFNFLFLTALSLLLLGVTVYFLPFVTPKTVKMMGYKQGMRLGRITGLSLVIIGLIFAVIIFLARPTPAGPAEPAKLWEVQTSGKTAYASFVYENKLFATAGEYLEFGSPSHLLYAIDAGTGKVSWKVDAGKGIITGMPLVYKDHIVWEQDVLSEEGIIKIFDTKTGNEVDDIEVPKELPDEDPSNIHNGKKYIIKKNKLSVVSLKDNKKIWDTIRESNISDLIVQKNKVYYAEEKTQKIYCHNYDTGKIEWIHQVARFTNVKNPDLVKFSFVINSGKLFVANYDGKITGYKLPGKN
ncbi:MAG: PQQ-binding-like beta-propeller repeat protein [bacterium]|nr:PQQ-binding-like beta-propeller repeat protein [bacterium]